MARRPRLLPFAYLLALSTVVALLAVVGALIDRLPLVPRRLSRAYGAGLLRLAAASTAPLDAWVVPGPPHQGTETAGRSRRRHN